MEICHILVNSGIAVKKGGWLVADMGSFTSFSSTVALSQH